MLATPFTAALLSYALMVAAYYFPHRRFFHIPVMASVILFDIGMPFYLYTHRDWWHRLVEQQELFSFLVWMHLGLLVTLYALYAVQIHTAARMFKGMSEVRGHHRTQGKALLLARGLAILTGAILATPA